MSTVQKPREVIREGAAEVREKLKADLSNWGRFRRFISLAPTMACLDCEGTGHVHCSGCGGSGKHKVVWNDEEAVCATCEGKGTVTCTECVGRGRVPNTRRKFFLALFAIGGLGWAYILFRLWGGDVLPEQRAKYLNGGGGGGVAQKTFAPRSGKAIPSPGASTSTPTDAAGTPAGGNPNVGNGTMQPPPAGAAPPPDNMGGATMPGGPRGGQMLPRGALPPVGQ